jgi:hypothetical protein
MSDVAAAVLAQEAADLDSYDQKLKLVHDRVQGVVRGYSWGAYFYGPGGSGKSFNIQRILTEQEAKLGVKWVQYNSHMTAKGLYRVLEKHPQAVHLLEDMERVVGDPEAQGVLRSALWAQPGREREVTWTTGGVELRFPFKGGIIMVGNRPLADLPELRALASRISVHELEITDAEMVAQLHRLARYGFSRQGFGVPAQVVFTAEGGIRAGEGEPAKEGPAIEPAKCLEIADLVIAECRQARCRPDLRVYECSCMDFLQWAEEHASCDWRDLVSTRIRQAAAHFRHEVNHLSAEERRQRDRETVRTICAQTEDRQERLRLWKERTEGKGQSTYYRRLKEVESREFDLGQPGLS